MKNIVLKMGRIKRVVVTKLMGICLKKESGNEQLIVALVMIAISVALVLIFKEKINTLLTNFMTNVTTKINAALGV